MCIKLLNLSNLIKNMPRREGVDGRKLILECLKDGKPRSIRELEKETGLRWNAIYYWLRNKENPENLVLKGCVEEIRVVDKTLNVAQDMYKYKITEYGLKYCLGTNPNKNNEKDNK